MSDHINLRRLLIDRLLQLIFFNIFGLSAGHLFTRPPSDSPYRPQWQTETRCMLLMPSRMPLLGFAIYINQSSQVWHEHLRQFRQLFDFGKGEIEKKYQKSVSFSKRIPFWGLNSRYDSVDCTVAKLRLWLGVKEKENAFKLYIELIEREYSNK